jgi:fumarate reductase subunit D
MKQKRPVSSFSFPRRMIFFWLFVVVAAVEDATDRNETVTTSTSAITNATTIATSNCSHAISVEPFKRFVECMHDRDIANNCTCLEPFSQSLTGGGEVCHSLLNSTVHLCDLLACSGCADAESHAARTVAMVLSFVAATFCVCCIVITWTWCERQDKDRRKLQPQQTIGGPDHADGVPDAFFKKPNSV